MESVKIDYITLLEGIQRFLHLDGVELKSDRTEDNRYRGLVVVPSNREGGFITLGVPGTRTTSQRRTKQRLR